VGWGALCSSVAGQQLSLKRSIPGSTPYDCPPVGAPANPAAEEREQATQLASTAAQAVILGDLARARGLLDRAAQLDPSSADVAYRHARVLEELGERKAAVSEYCRVLAVDPHAEGVGDARRRVDALTAADQVVPPETAVAALQEGLARVDAGALKDALTWFETAAARGPDWPEAVYDRGVVEARLGYFAEAARDLRRYLELRPDAIDAIPISQRIGTLESLALVPGASPTAALALGMVFPGTGQLYGGRVVTALAVAFLTAGSVLAGALVKRTDVTCRVPTEADGTCPSGQRNVSVRRPYLWAGVGVGAALSTGAALEAFVTLRNRRRAREGGASIDIGGATVGAPTVVLSGDRLDLHLVRITF
jgi:tetratricopeptide (TPR) repeat protein